MHDLASTTVKVIAAFLTIQNGRDYCSTTRRQGRSLPSCRTVGLIFLGNDNMNGAILGATGGFTLNGGNFKTATAQTSNIQGDVTITGGNVLIGDNKLR